MDRQIETETPVKWLIVVDGYLRCSTITVLTHNCVKRTNKSVQLKINEISKKKITDITGMGFRTPHTLGRIEKISTRKTRQDVCATRF